jgi:hypothetical protein
MTKNFKKNLKIVSIFIFGFFVVTMVITALNLLFRKYFNLDASSIFGWLIDVPVAFLVWRIFFKWIEEIKINYFYETNKE